MLILNYFKTAARNLQKNKIFSAINIFGLAIGLTCFILIVAFLYDELDYDHYPIRAGDIYRVGVQINQNGGMADYPDVDVAVGAGMKNTYPEVQASTRLLPYGAVFAKYGDKQFKEQHLALCDSNFLEIFSIPLLEGDPKTALAAPGLVVVTSAFAKKYFGEAPAIGKMIMINGPLKVSGVIDQVPDNSHFHFDAFISMATNKGSIRGQTWSNIGFYTYLLLNPGADPRKLEAKFPELTEKYVIPEAQHDMGISLAEARKTLNGWRFYLMPLKDIHLRSKTKYELEPNGDIQYIYIFGALGVFILLLACVNFTNLSTAGSARRSREVGIRKVLGSARKQLIAQFLIEALVLSFCAMVLALFFAYLLLPFFSQLSGKQISINAFLNAKAVGTGLALVLLVGILAGIYPSFFLSSFRTIAVLKGAIANTPARRSLLRSGLVIFQFVISTSLIIATLVVYQQLHFMQTKKLGFDREQVLMIQDTYALQKNQGAFKQQLLQDGRVIHATISRDAPVLRAGNEVDGSEVYAKEIKAGENPAEIHAYFFHVDYDYLATLGMKMTAGRYFSRDFSSDSSAVVINETAVRDLGWTNNQAALDKTIVSSGMHEYKVVGVVKDFNYTSARQRIAPLMMMLGNNYGSMMVKLKTDNIAGFIADTKQKWAQFNAELPFSYYFLDDRFASMYTAEQKTGQLFTMFAVIAILIACLGLFGLVAFTAQQRTKEMGVRKVLGASVNQVLLLLSRDFLWLVGIAFLISVPVTWWAMHSWLNNFAYRIELTGWVFLLAGITTFVIALVTISFQAIKAALANPVKSLRTE